MNHICIPISKPSSDIVSYQITEIIGLKIRVAWRKISFVEEVVRLT